MRKIIFFTLTFIVLCPVWSRAQVEDSVDVRDYDVTLDLSNGTPFPAYADITVRLLRPCATVGLDFIGMLDSVKIAGAAVTTPDITALPTGGIAPGQDFHIEVWYRGRGYLESGGWGGFHFESSMHYNLGVGFNANPHVMGRVLMPCRDNFHDKATYTFCVRTKAGWTAECGGICQSVAVDSVGCEHSVWRISQQTPTYLVSVSQAQWTRMHDTIASVYGDYPLTVGYLNRSETNVRQAFAELDSVVPQYERCFGPYRWGRIGYIATTKGSMEHVNNIALAREFVSSTTERAQTTIAHELGHAWFGNLVTCATEGDMWINEGGASFCSEVAMESVLGRKASDNYYQRNLEAVLRTTHVVDNNYRPLHNMPHNFTYGSTTYDKGWMVWHSLRGYLGEEEFYRSMNLLMERCAFGNLDAYQLRDSLSRYSGVDLTDFFDFHVFSPGFVDYHVELSSDGTTLSIRQQTVGTSNTLRSNLVPITFYSDSDSCKRMIAFEGEEWSGTVELPFVPVCCVLDRDLEISDAATVEGKRLEGYGISTYFDEEHVRVGSANEINFHVEYHMAPAFGEMPEGVVRRAGRYWMLRGDWGESDSVKAYFRFVRTGVNSTYTNLDRGFYHLAATVDSLGLFYRPDGSRRWHFVSRMRSGSANEGWLYGENLLPGEYTLAVVDFEHLAIDRPQSADTHLFPNPLKEGQPLTVEVDSEAPFSVTIFDEGGRQVWQKTDCRSGQKMSPGLKKGTYFVRIENNFISLHSKLIQL